MDSCECSHIFLITQVKANLPRSLTLFAFNLLFSQWAQLLPSKHVIMFAVVVFEVGSLLCGVAPNMVVLILGRAIAGVGAAGIFTSGMIIIAELTSLHERAKYFGLFGVW